MSDIFEFSKILPLNSIVNPNVSELDYLDYNTPFSFFDYLKYINSNLSPNDINVLYVEYIKQWNLKKQNSINVVNDTIKERYIDLLKELTLKYSSLEEKRFLTSIDFEDEFDLDVVISFYSKKIVEICKFYLDKREKLKFKIEKNKTKGTEFNTQNFIRDKILDLSYADPLEVGLYQKIINQDELINSLDIEIEELYDLYTNYFDIDPNKGYLEYDVNTQLRKDYFTANINSIDADLFLNIDTAIKNQIFENVRTFLIELGRIFTVNYNIDSINLNCKPDEKLYNIVNKNKDLATRLVSLRNSLIRKYSGSDYYYLLTGDTINDTTIDLLFKAENPAANLLNRHYPSTASIEEDSYIKSAREIGLFFTPEKNSILYYSVPEKKYKIDYTKLEPNKVYIFPDPELYGNTSGISRKFYSDYPLIHISEYTKSVKNLSNPLIEGDIESNPHNQDYYSYFSKGQLINDVSLGKDGLKTSFSSLYNKGIVVNYTNDIYGNEYALFKNKNRENLVQSARYIELSTIISEEYDGGPITYSNHELLPEQIYSGHPSWVQPNIWASDYYYNLLIEGGIGGIVNGLMERGMYVGGYIVDGLIINRNNITNKSFDIDLNKLNPDNLITIDGKLYYNTNPIYITYILNNDSNINIKLSAVDYIYNGNFYNRNPKNINQTFNKTLNGVLDNDSDFDPSFDYNYILSSIKYKDFDAGYISDKEEEKFDYESQTKFIVNKVNNNSRTIISENPLQEEKNPYEMKNSVGSIYFKEVTTGKVMPLLSGIGVQYINKYPDKIIDEIQNSVIDFNIHNNLIWIRTSNYVIFENIRYEDYDIVYTGTGANYINYGNQKYLDNISNPFIFENKRYCMIVHLSSINADSNDFYIIPIIYKIDYETVIKEKIFPLEDSDLSIFKNNSIKNPIKLAKINKPVLTYNTRNSMFCIMATIEDGNGFPSILQTKFKFNDINISYQSVKLYNFGKNEFIKTYNFYDSSNLSTNNIILNDLTSNFNNTFSNGAILFS